MSVEVMLHEASCFLITAKYYESALSDIASIDYDVLRMRVLIASVAARTYTSLLPRINIMDEVHELQIIQNFIMRAVEHRFGISSTVMKEFSSHSIRKLA